MKTSGVTAVHKKPAVSLSFDRLDALWERYPQYHEMAPFTTLDALLEEHESYAKDFDELREEYEAGRYDRFLVQLSWSDLAYRYATRRLIESAESMDPPRAAEVNPYVEAFMEQFAGLDTDYKACFLFPESFVTQFFVIMEVCKRAESLRTVKAK